MPGAGSGPAHAPPPLAPRPEVLVELVHRAPLRVRGPASGRIYAFTLAEPVQTVDATDAPALLRDGLFRAV